MSTDLIFNACLATPADHYPGCDGLHVLAVQAGSNNLRTEQGRIRRRWTAAFMGSPEQIMMQACDWVGGVEGGTLRGSSMLPWRGRDRTPASWLRFVRSVIDAGAWKHVRWMPNPRLRAMTAPMLEEVADVGFDAAAVAKASDYCRHSLPAERAAIVFKWARQPQLEAHSLVEIHDFPRYTDKQIQVRRASCSLTDPLRTGRAVWLRSDAQAFERSAVAAADTVEEVQRVRVCLQPGDQPWSRPGLCIVVDRLADAGEVASILGDVDAETLRWGDRPMRTVSSTRGKMAEAGRILIDGQRPNAEQYVGLWQREVAKHVDIDRLASVHGLRVVATFSAGLQAARSCKPCGDATEDSMASFEEFEQVFGPVAGAGADGRFTLDVELSDAQTFVRLLKAYMLMRAEPGSNTPGSTPDARIALRCEVIEGARRGLAPRARRRVVAAPATTPTTAQGVSLLATEA